MTNTIGWGVGQDCSQGWIEVDWIEWLFIFRSTNSQNGN